MHASHTSPQRTSSPIHRLALAANAAFSATTGAIAVTVPHAVGSWLGDVPPSAVTGVGTILLGFAGLVGYTAARRFREPLPVGLISIADLSWVGGTALTLALWPRLFSAVGVGTTLALASVVGGFAVLQLYGLVAQFRTHPLGAGPTHRVEVEIPANAPADALWEVVCDLGSIADHSAALRSSAMLVGTHAEVGASRRCVNTRGETWNETCTVVEPGRALTLAFDADDAAFPFPFRAMTGGWVLEPIGETTRVKLWWDVTPQPGLKGDLTVVALAAIAPRGMRRLIANMATTARGRCVRRVVAGRRVSFKHAS